MVEPGPDPAESADIRQRLESLEETHRATLNILEDFDQERQKLKLLQQATMNLLEDVEEERQGSDATQAALMNMLEDIEDERIKTELANSKLEAANKELEAFSYSISHDLRAPLRAISGFSQAVLEDYAPQLDQEGQRYLTLIQDNAHRMGRLIDDLLAFSRLGRQQMTDSDLDMESMAQSVFEELAALEPNRVITFSVKDMPHARGDSSMVRQILVNLISNAIKFTKSRQNSLIEMGFVQESGAYYVKDNGVGFDMKYVGKLFGVFQRLHSVKDFEGTGVGLALVQRIVVRHGGKVWAEASLDGGATFFFTLTHGD
jgi:light-regulated signal transduction histidine kinase (bacteriophytochrome)